MDPSIRECHRRRSQEQGPRAGEGSGVPGPHRFPCRGGSAAADSFGVGTSGGEGVVGRAGVLRGHLPFPGGSVTGRVLDQPCPGEL